MAEQIITPQPRKFFAQRFALWLSMCAMFMAFAGLTSAYIVRRAQPDWLEFNLPKAFIFSTIVIFTSSITMMLANHAYKNDMFHRFRMWLWLTFILGIAFFILQLQGWNQLEEMKVFWSGINSNPSASFLIVISGLHLAHIAGGLVFLAIALYRATFVFNDAADSAVKDIIPTKGIRMDLLVPFWHFVDILWLYLFVFFLINK